jgi:predicted N-formylglutamate amidohydrolase
MPKSDSARISPALLLPDEPPAFRILNQDSALPLLLVCDHASDRIPQALGDLGLDAFARRCHLAVDIGAEALTEHVASALGAAAVLAQYSRLVVDCNRHLMDPAAFLEFGDGIEVQGNRSLRQADKDRRAAAIHIPYHQAIEAQLERYKGLGTRPVFLSIRSFTPVMNGRARHCEVGILWDQDQDLHQHFLDTFRQAGFATGDNEPYSGKAPADFTIDHHAEANALPCIGIEIRQDLLSDAAGVERIGELLASTIAALPALDTITHGKMPEQGAAN